MLGDEGTHTVGPRALDTCSVDPGNLFERVLESIETSLRETPRDLYVLYLNAIHRHCFEGSSLLQEMPRSIWSKAVDRLTVRWPMAVYRARD